MTSGAGLEQTRHCVIASYMGQPIVVQSDDNILISDFFLKDADPRFAEVAEGFVRLSSPMMVSGDAPPGTVPGPWSVTYRLTGDRDRWGSWYAVKQSDSSS